MAQDYRVENRRRCVMLDEEESKTWSTSRLMARRARMLSLEDSAELSDCYPEELADIGQHEELFFKDDPRWQPQYDMLRQLLSEREHYPSKPERRRLRQERAKRRK